MLNIITADGVRVPATLVETGSARLVILSHGIATNKDEDGIYTEFAENVLAPEFDSIRFDFRGHGDSESESENTTIAGEILDFMAVVRWARQRGYKKLFHLGTSFGASITLLSLARFSFEDFASMAFWNPVISYENTFINPKVAWAREFFSQTRTEDLAYRKGTLIPDTSFVIGPQMTMELLHFQPAAKVWPKGIPLLIIHGDRDSAVPCSDAVDYQQNNSEQVTLHVIPGVDHGFDDQVTRAYSLTVEWFKDHQ